MGMWTCDVAMPDDFAFALTSSIQAKSTVPWMERSRSAASESISGSPPHFPRSSRRSFFIASSRPLSKAPSNESWISSLAAYHMAPPQGPGPEYGPPGPLT